MSGSALRCQANSMQGAEELLSLDLEDSDYLYRIRRGNRIVYVSVFPALIPKCDRTNGLKVLRHLGKIPKWNEGWRTLTVETSADGVLSEMDCFLPHSLAELHISSRYYYNLLDLTRIRRISDRVSLVSHGHQQRVLKIARFEHELEALSTEVRAYGILQAHHSTLAPKFLGYVYEEEEDRVIGFLTELLHGSHPQLEDRRMCEDAIQELHKIGIVHGDLNKYNILIGKDGAQFVDFEEAIFKDSHNFEPSKEAEAKNLVRSLLDSSGLGNHGL